MAGLWSHAEKAGRRWSGSGAHDTSLQEELFKDPKVSEAVRGAGVRALGDPAAQNAVLNLIKERAPHVANEAGTLVQSWAKDPEVQARAKYMAGMAVHATGHMGENAIHCIEQGPEGVQVLAFVGGAASMVLAVLQVLNVFSVVGATFTYVVSVYQVIFSFTTMLFEAKMEWLHKVQKLNDLHDKLMLNMRFLSLSLGRGMFYIFQGTLWWVLSDFFGLLEKLLAVYMCGLGALYVCMHFGIMPQHVATKMRQISTDYVKVTP